MLFVEKLTCFLLFFAGGFLSSTEPPPLECLSQVKYLESVGYGYEIGCFNLTNQNRIDVLISTGAVKTIRMKIENSTLNGLDFLANFTQLKDVSIRDSIIQLNETASNVTIFQDIKKLSIVECNIKNSVLESVIDGVSIERIDFSNNRIKQLKPKQQLVSLQSLDLGYNNFLNWNDLDVCKFPNLELLNLTKNCLKVVDSYGNQTNCTFPKLKFVSMRSNKIVEFGFTAAPQLEDLDLSDNLLITLDTNVLSRLSSLKILNLSNNLLKLIDCTHLTNLITLNLINNRIEQFSETCSTNDSKLENLALDKNKLTSITLESMPNLKYLTLSSNPLVSKRLVLSNLPSLEGLMVGSCNLGDLHNATIKQCDKIKFLDLSNNSLGQNDLNFWNLTNLQKLSLCNNSISQLDTNLLAQLKSLKNLDVSQNKITKFTLPQLSNLITLNMSNNRLSYLNEDNLLTLDNLGILDLRANRLSNLDYKKLADNITTLKMIDVIDNSFSCQFLSSMIDYFNKSSIEYAILPQELSYYSQNFGGVICHETRQSTKAEQLVESSGDQEQSRINIWIVAGGVIVLHVVIFVGVYKMYVLFKNRRAQVGEFQLLYSDQDL